MGKRRNATPWMVGVAVGYVVLIVAIYKYIVWPWNLIVAGLVVLKALIFFGVLVQANRVRPGRRPPPPRGPEST